jgi:hypothetical protein
MSKCHVTTKRTKATKDWEIITFQFLNFVLFASFVVSFPFPFWLGSAARIQDRLRVSYGNAWRNKLALCSGVTVLM